MKSSLWRSTVLVSLGAVLGRLLGVGREAVFAHYFGANLLTDAYLVAVLIPYLIQNVVAGGSLQAALVPLVADEVARGGREAAARFVADLTVTVAVVMMAVSVVLALCAGPITRVTASGFGPEAAAAAASILRWCAGLIVLNGVLAVALGGLNTFGEFSTTALLSPVLNGVQIVVMIALAPVLGISAAVAGLLAGTLAQCAQQLRPLGQVGVRLSRGRVSMGLCQRLLPAFIPAALASLVAQGNPLADKIIGSYLAPGSITHLNYADLFAGSIAIVTTTVALVTFPVMSVAVAEGDQERARHVLRQAVHVNLLTAIPVSAFLGAFGPDVVRAVYGWGRLSPEGLDQVARCVVAYSAGIPFVGLFYVLLRACYALKQPRLALLLSLVYFAVHAIVGLALAPRLGPAGLALGTSVGALTTGLAGWFLLRNPLLRGVGKDAARWTLRLGLATLLSLVVPGMLLMPWGAMMHNAPASLWRLPLAALLGAACLLPLVHRIDPDSKRVLETTWQRLAARLSTA